MKIHRTKVFALVILISASSLFLVLAIFASTGNLATADREIYGAFAPLINPVLTSVMLAISFLGSWYVWLSLAAILLIFAKTRANLGLSTLFATLAGTALTLFFKMVLKIPRPHINWLTPEIGYGFPSAHAGISTAFVAVALYFLWRSKLKNPWKILMTFFAILFLLGVGFSRIYLGVHNASDVVAGYLLGAAATAITIFLGTVFQVKVRARFSRK